MGTLFLKIKSLEIILKKSFYTLIFILFIVPLVFLFELLTGKNLVIRFIQSPRIGVWSLQLEYYSRVFQLKEWPQNKKLIFISGKPANHQLLEMYKKKLPIFENNWLFDTLWYYVPFIKKVWFFDNSDPRFTEESKNVMSRKKPALNFSEEEKERGKQWLESKNITDDDWFVCIYARDEGYLNKTHPNSKLYGDILKNDFSYYNFRNADINTFDLAIQYIVDQGGFVIRIGCHPESKLKIEHEKVIDYAYYDRTDFLDIYLPANCKFFLGTPGGGGEYLSIFDKPRAVVNSIPIGLVPWTPNTIYIYKKVKHQKTGKYFPLYEIIQKDWTGVKNFGKGIFDEMDHLHEHSLVYEDNTPEEIYDLTKEMLERLEGSFVEVVNYKSLLESHYKSFPPDHTLGHVKAPIGQKFLLDNKETHVNL